MDEGRKEGVGAELPITVSAALAGTRGELQRRIAAKGIEIIELLLRKNHDYGASAFKSPILQPEMPPRTAIRVRMSDKIQRIMTLIQQESQVKDESIDQTIDDLGGYCILHGVDPFLPTFSSPAAPVSSQAGSCCSYQVPTPAGPGLGTKRSGFPID